MCKFKDEILSAKAEIATWTELKLSSVQLEGTDKYLQLEKRRLEAESSQNEEQVLVSN